MLRHLKELLLGLRTYPRALRFSKEHRLWGFYVLPALLNILILGSIFWLEWHYSDRLVEWLTARAQWDMLPEWANEALSWLILLVVKILVIFLFFKLYSTLVLLFLSPVLGLIAEKVQTILLDQPEPEFSFSLLLKNILRGLALTLRNVALELSLVLLLVLLGFMLPFFSPFTTVTIILIESYFIGFGMIDLRNEFLGLSAKESRQLIWKHRGLAVGNGLGFLLCVFIPLLGVLFGPIVSVIAASLGIAKADSANQS